MKQNKWGNSVLAFNFKFWPCSYCGKLLKDNTPFEIMKLDGETYVFDQESCMSIKMKKIEAQRADS